MEGYIYLSMSRVPIGTHSDTPENHRTAPAACTALFISHPFGVNCISLTFYVCSINNCS